MTNYLVPIPTFSWTVPGFPTTTEDILGVYSFSIPNITQLPEWTLSIGTSLATSLAAYVLAWIIWLPSEFIYLLGTVGQNIGISTDITISNFSSALTSLIGLFLKDEYILTSGTGPLQPFIIVTTFILFGVSIITILTVVIKKVVELL